MTTLNVRIEEKTKAQATQTLAKLGLDMSSAVKLFLTQVIKEDGLPFIPTNNAKAIRARWHAQMADAMKHGKVYKTGKEAIADLI